MKFIRSRNQESVKELKSFNGKFTSVFGLRVKLIEEFGEKVPSNISFTVGYYGQHNKKFVLGTVEDLESMYAFHSIPLKRVVNLWCECEDKDEEPGPPKSKRRKMSQREEKESMVDEIVQELKEKNDENYSEAQYRLWARMIVTGAHTSRDTAPRIPMFSGTPLKRKTPRVTPEESIITAAAAIAKAVNVASSQTTIVNSPQTQSPLSVSGISPGRAADIRDKSYGQLSTLKKLFQDGVLSQDEFDEQKDLILDGLRKL